MRVSPGYCNICSCRTVFFVAHNNYRETYHCVLCRSVSRHRHVAAVLTELFGLARFRDLPTLSTLRVYEAASYGPVYAVLRKLPHSTFSEFFPGVEPGTTHGGVRCEDLQRLSFAAESFDLVVTQDVLEHVQDPDAAFREIRRVLIPGGYHVFTVPLNRPDTVTRVSKDGVHLLPPVYHGDQLRSGSILVYTDFGLDIADRLKSFGFTTDILYLHRPEHGIFNSRVLVSKRVS